MQGKKVAFLGVNAGDSTGPAERFLRDKPLPFPSYLDKDEDIAKTIDAPANYLGLLRQERQARQRPPGRLPQRVGSRRRHAAVPRLMEVRRPRDEHELAAALALREEVFGEQGVTAAADLDGLDGEALQLVAVDGDVLGTCRMLIEPGGTARFGRLCVRAGARGRGIAAALLRAAEAEARAGAVRIGMHAQTDALPLYERVGYTPYGEPFDEEGIEHLGMEKPLT